MYKSFFELRESPFDINPNPGYLVFTPQVEKAVEELTYGIQTRKGLILLTGEAGTGKTTLINSLLAWLRQRETPVAFIFNPHLEIGHLYELILAEFGVTFDSRLNGDALIPLKRWLSQCYRAGKTAVLIVDEAQGLSLDVLQEIRMLLNLETPSEKLLQIVLAGQPEFEKTLLRPELCQLRQRIAVRCNTAPFRLEETHRYIQERLRIAGARRECPVFSSEAMNAVHLYARGIPRVVNLLCEHVLINAYVDRIRPVPARLVADVARDFQLETIAPFCPPRTFDEVESDEIIARQSMADISALFEAPKPLTDWESTPTRERELEVSTLLQIPLPPLSAPDSNQIEERQQLDLIALFGDSDAGLAAGMARKAAPSPSLAACIPLVDAKADRNVSSATMRRRILASGEAAKRALIESGRWAIPYALRPINGWRAIWSDRRWSFVARRLWRQTTAASFRWLRQPIRPDRGLQHWRSARRHRCRAILDSRVSAHLTASLSRWLQEPFDPTQWLSTTPRLFASLRTATHKKP
ncbi:MAG TPA: AAA family ATPase [Candidatus Acidoferrales bacterium]|nr:AAA family ATPase [Candidatus Acidoferrales bacterium]